MSPSAGLVGLPGWTLAKKAWRLRRPLRACYVAAMRRQVGNRWDLRAGIGFIVLLASATLAGAHPQFALSTVNRYGKLVLQAPRQTRIFFTLMVGDVPALGLRQQADRDGDGTLSDSEQQGLATLLRDRVASGVHVYRGATEVVIPWAATPLHLDSPAVSATAFACEISATLPPAGNGEPGGTTGQVDELRYDDRVELPPVGELELRVEEGPGMRVLETQTSLAPPSAPGRPATGPNLLFQWSGPPRSSVSDRSIRIRFAPASALALRRQRPWTQTRWPWLVGSLVMALALAAGYSLRRLGRPSA